MYIKQPVFHGSSIRGFFSWLICAGVQTPIGVVRDKLINPRVGFYILGGSSQLGYVVSNHGDRFRPLRIFLWDPFQMAMNMAYKWAGGTKY